MTPRDFEASLATGFPPGELSIPLLALWWDAAGDWSRAHQIAAADEAGREAAWVHAYLHRREGDAFNARYWYARAARPVATVSLEDEKAAILAALLAADGSDA